MRHRDDHTGFYACGALGLVGLCMYPGPVMTLLAVAAIAVRWAAAVVR